MSDARQRVCILTLARLPHDSRVLRQIEFAAPRYATTVVAPQDDFPRAPDVRVAGFRMRKPGLAEGARLGGLALAGFACPRLWEVAALERPSARHALPRVIESGARLIHANDLAALPVAIHAARRTGAKVLFDAHEYSPEQHVDRWFLRWLKNPSIRHVFDRYVPRADAVVTVSPGIAERIRADTGRPVEVVMSAPPYAACAFHPTAPERIRMIYFGLGTRRRRLELMLDALALLPPRFSLSLMVLRKDEGYIRDMEERAARTCPGRVEVLPPVPSGELVSALQGWDLCMSFIPPATFNLLHMLPNRVFTGIMAGLGVVAGPSPDVEAVLREHDCGLVAPDFSARSLAAALSTLTTERIDAMKRNALRAARTLNADTEMRKLHAVYDALLAAAPAV